MEEDHKMETDERKGNAKADEEETYQKSLPPKTEFKVISNADDDDLFYINLVGQHRAQKAIDTDSSAEQVQRKIFRVRNKDVCKILGEEDKRVEEIHSLSGATVGILCDTSARIHRHRYLELLGTADEVKTAKLLIVDAITEEYRLGFVPTALMPTSLCHHEMAIPLNKVISFVGIDGKNILKMESESGAWIEIDTLCPPDGKTRERVVNIYGDGQQIANAVKVIQEMIYVSNSEPEGDKCAKEPNPEEGDNNAEDKIEEPNPESKEENDAEDKTEDPNPESKEENDAEDKTEDPNPESKEENDADDKTEDPNPEPEGDNNAEEKTKEQYLEPGDKYAKAKIEEPNLRLPKALLKPDGDPNDDLCYMRIFEDDSRRSQHLAEAVAAGAQATRKVYRIRNKELVKLLGPDDRGMKYIHRHSKATIGILADAESNEHRQSYMDLVGTVEEVTAAEELILDAVLESYDDMIFPVILMPPTVHHHRMIVPFFKLFPLIGVRRSNIVRMEMVSGAWIKVDVSKSPPGGSELERIVDIYGPRTNVIRAMLNVQSVICEPWESAEVAKKLTEEYGDPEIIDGQLRIRGGRRNNQQFGGTCSEAKGSEKEGASSSSTEKQQDVDKTGKGKAPAAAG